MTQPATILVVEDELNIRTALVTMLEKRGYVAASAGTAEEALRLLDETTVDLVITDLKMPGIGGMELLRKVKEAWPATEVVVMTAYGSIETAVEAMRSGAYDYITKPIDRDRFPVLVEKALERHFLTSENRQLRDRLETKARFEDMIGDSALMHQIYNLVEMVAASDVTVLVVGESGTGKELLARAIHQKSPRAGGPFISVNCGALPDTLLESELFGYEKGAFSGASNAKPGLFELAHTGTIFLDEIGELEPKMQVKLLRVLDGTPYYRLGGVRKVSVDVRVIAATNQDLKETIQAGRFRRALL